MRYEIDHFPGRELSVDGEPYLYFGGTSYLGLQTDAKFQALLISNIKTYGTNYGASRKSNIRLKVYAEAETYLAGMVGSEACLSLSSGYLAGQLVGQQFNSDDYKCFYAPNTHCALSVSNAKCYESYTALHAAVTNNLREKKLTSPVVFLDAVDFSGVNYPDFEGLKTLPLQDIILVIDDSHGIGVVGNKGSGVYREIATLKPKELIVCCSLGKGFGIQAGAILGTTKRIEAFSETAFFGGASPAAPAALATLLQASSIYKNKRIKLRENIHLFHNETENISFFTWMKGHPVYSFSKTELSSFLTKNKVLISNFSYPNEDVSAMSRLVLSAAHHKKDVRLLSKHINRFLSKKD